MALTPKQKRFVHEYMVDLNATQAAIRAGYSEKTARSVGSENLTKPDIKAALAEKQHKVAHKTDVTIERVLAELAKVGFSNMHDYMRVTADGDPVLDLSNLTREQAAALSEVTVEDFTEGRGDDARDVRRIKFKLHDKISSLVQIGKHLGMFPNRVEVGGRDGKPIEVRDVTDRDRLAALALMVAKASKAGDANGG